MKRIMAVDDEALGLKALVSAISKADPEAEVVAFSSSREALAYAKENELYAAFLDIQMPVMTGTELGKAIKNVNPKVSIIFATGYDSYMGDAFSLHASGYVLKPVTPKKVRAELENLSHVISNAQEISRKDAKRVRCQCFGNFELFIDEKPVEFRYEKSKEIVAFIVSKHGSMCPNAQIISCVWDDDLGHDSYFRVLKKDIADTLKSYQCEELMMSQKGCIGINTSIVSCDYYDYIDGVSAAQNLYLGEFMSQYSWGEIINAGLEDMKLKNKP